MNERSQKIQRALDGLEKTLAALKNDIPVLKKRVEDQLGLAEQTSDYRPKVAAAIIDVENALKDYLERFDEAMMDIERWEDESPSRVKTENRK